MTIEHKKEILNRQIEIAKLNLQNNIEDIDLSKYMLDQIMQKDHIANFHPFIKSTSIDLILKLFLKDNLLYKIIKFFRRFIS